MAKFRFHKLAAIGVLIGFAVWMGTGEFSSVGSAAAENDKKPAEAEQAKPPVRTVAVITPPRTHACPRHPHVRPDRGRQARRSGNPRGRHHRQAAGQAGPARQGGDLVLMLDAEEKTAAVETARQLVAQRQAEAEAQERLVKSGNSPQASGRHRPLRAGRRQVAARGRAGRTCPHRGQGAVRRRHRPRAGRARQLDHGRRRSRDHPQPRSDRRQGRDQRARPELRASSATRPR